MSAITTLVTLCRLTDLLSDGGSEVYATAFEP